ncbi:RNA-binding protein 1-like [Solanum pennellii]|uniref:RNA-binding protein 1-like n=1 Tax=Solanum pennellii TaxID=28526 RepID=A0ABM1GZD6_SOLPN|nr:RNA-binding protein 1-like [Solanum pennellii]
MAAGAYRKDTNTIQLEVMSPDLTPLFPEIPLNEYEAPSSRFYYDSDDEWEMMRLRSTASIEASYQHYLRTGEILSYESILSVIMGIEDVGMVPEDILPPNASSTLYVEGLPEDCTTREVAHIFRHFGGYKEVRLVPKPSIYPGANTLILCFVDFLSPLHAAVAMDALQGYKFDLGKHDSGNLLLQFARNPGARSVRSGGGNR